MRYRTKTTQDTEADTFICFVYEDDNTTGELFKYLDKLAQGELYKQIFEYNTIKRAQNDIFKFSIKENIKAVVAGLGKKSELTKQKLSQICANAARSAKSLSQNQILAVELVENLKECESENITKEDAAQIIICGLRIGLYEFSKYLSNKKPQIETIEIIDTNITNKIDEKAKIGVYCGFAMKFAKDLINEQASIVTPEYIADLASEIAKEDNLKCKIYNKSQIKELNMNAFLAVGRGSVNEPRFIHLTYTPKNTPRKKVALIGKGITFDAGGLDIKPATSMLTMKSDMSGAASVLGIIQAIAKLKPDVELHVISALCENMPSGSSYKQGDVLTAMNGKTIEIDNTDAEGRLTLADALCYADKLNADEVIDLATLTGAVIVSLGSNITGVLGNNQEQINKFLKIARNSCENVWQMPILDELKDNLKSEIADMKNTGGRNAGTSTAGWFLSNFTHSKKWMHLDIAGTAYIEKSNRETLSGPTGVMIRSLINYILE